MANVASPGATAEMRAFEATARQLGFDVPIFEIRRAEDIASAFAALKDQLDALNVVPDPLVINNRVRIATLALTARLPAFTAAANIPKSAA